MRISLLQQREPFGEIFSNTLGNYWRAVYGKPFQVTWHANSDGKVDCGDKSDTGLLIANYFLNAVFHPQIAPAAFDPIRREFSRSTVAWRRPLQRMYVQAATHSVSSHWLAHAAVTICPKVPDLEQLLIIPGNQKIRILDHVRGTSTCLLKAGFESTGLQNEVHACTQAAALGIPVPRLISQNLAAGHFTEEYISATPLNRLASRPQATRLRDAALASLQILARQTEAPAERELENVSENANLLSFPTLASLDARGHHTVRKLQLLAKHGPIHPIPCCQTHGDLQPANILCRGDQYWLIDWESAARRFAGYDPLVLASASRFPNGLADRLQNLCESGGSEAPYLANWPGLDWSCRESRQQAIAIFLLEEIQAKLFELSNPMFVPAPSKSFTLLDESRRWTEMVEER